MLRYLLICIILIYTISTSVGLIDNENIYLESSPFDSGWDVNVTVKQPVNFDIYLSYDSQNVTISKIEYYNQQWIDVSSKFKEIDYIYQGNNKVKYINNLTPIEQYQIRVWITGDPSIFYFVVKPNSMTVPVAIERGVFYVEEMNIGNDQESFKSTWNTNFVSSRYSNDTQIWLPLDEDGIYDFIVDWGDGTTSHITEYEWMGNRIHTYEEPGIYNLSITGKIEGWSFQNKGDKLKLIEISSWGPLQLGNLGHNFYGCKNLEVSATDILDTSNTTTLQNAFMDCHKFNGDLSNIDTSKVEEMGGMFYRAYIFNPTKLSWNTSKVKCFGSMFREAHLFNANVNEWDFSNVEHMTAMFMDAWAYNQPMDRIDTHNVNSMLETFYRAFNFNQDLSTLNVSNVTNMRYMLYLTDLSVENYDALLISWSEQPVQQNVKLDVTTHYSDNAIEARNKLINNYNWTIYDYGLARNASVSNISIGSAILGNHPVFRGYQNHIVNYIIINETLYFIEPQTDHIMQLDEIFMQYRFVRLYQDGTQVPSSWRYNLMPTLRAKQKVPVGVK